MAIRHKRTTTTGYTWTGSDLVDGQIGLNTTDGTAHMKKADGSVVEIGSYIGGSTYPDTAGALGEVLTADGSGLVEWKLPQTLSTLVYNADSTTIYKGQPVYVFSANGVNISVKLALNTSDATCAQTLGLANEDIAPGATGVIITQGEIRDIDTQTPGYSAGQALYLGSTAGALTTTKPYAPNHLVYLGFVKVVGTTNGRIFVKTQNGYELDEIHDADVGHTNTLTDNDHFVYDSASGTWRNEPLDISHDTTPTLGGDLDANGNDILNVNTIASSGTGLTLNDDGLYVRLTGGYITTPNSTTDMYVGANIATGGYITISAAANGNISLIPNGTGDVVLSADTVRVGDNNVNATITTQGTGDLTLSTNSGTNSGTVVIQDGTSGQIQLTPASSGFVFINGQTIGLRTNNTGGAIIGRAATTTAGAYQYPSLVVQKNRTDIATASMTNEPATILFQTRDNASVNTSFARLSSVYQGTGTNPVFDFRVSTDGFTSTANILNMGPGLARFGNSGGGYELTTYGTSDLTLSTDSGANTGKVIVENMVYNEVVYTGGSTTGTITPDAANGTIQKITLSGSITLNAFANPVAGQSMTLIVRQPASGGPYTLTSSMLFAGGSKTLSTAANAVDIISIFYDGTDYLASLSKGYA